MSIRMPSMGESFETYTAAIKNIDTGELAWLDFFDAVQEMLSRCPDGTMEDMGHGWLLRAAEAITDSLCEVSFSSITYQAWDSLIRYMMLNKPLPPHALAYFALSGKAAVQALYDRRWYQAARYIVFGGDERELAFAIATYMDDAGLGRE